VLTRRHPRQRREGLALRAGADQRDLVGREPVELREVHDEAVGNVEVAQVGRNLHVAHHRSADERNLAALCVCGVEYLLNAVHVTGEARDDHASRRFAEHLLDGRDQVAFGDHEPGHFGVGGAKALDFDTAAPMRPASISSTVG